MDSGGRTGWRFPGVDERIVAPESRAEIVDGQLVMAPPADPAHAVPHADLAYVLRAHVRDGFVVAIDMLTRTSVTSDFAPDASVFESEPDPETGERRLEQLAFQVVSEQPLSVQTSKARELSRRGVRRIFCLVTKHAKILEWSPQTDAWSAAPVEVIDDPLFARPLPTNALLRAASADTAVLKALREKGHPEFDLVREEGREAGRQEDLAGKTSDQLQELLAALMRDRRWPEG